MERVTRPRLPTLTADEAKKVSRRQLARLARLADEMNLGQSEREFYERAIIIGLEQALVQVREEAPRLEWEQFLLKIRQKVESNATWGQMESLCWDMLAHSPKPIVGSKVIELVCLYGNPTDAVQVLEKLSGLPVETYFLVNPELRSYLLLKLWLEKQEKGLRRYLLTKGIEAQLIPLEKLYIFWLLFGSEDPGRAFVYFQRYQEELEHAVREFGSKLQITEGRFKLVIGRLAIKSGYEAIARRILESIQPNQPEYKDALHLLLQVNIEKDAQGQCPLTRKLKGEKEWRERVKLFYEFLSESKRLGAIKDVQRPALNELLKDPLKWVPSIPEAWAAISQMLCEFADMESILPDLFSVWTANAARFHPFLAEKGLWGPVRGIQSRDEKRDRYWQGIAHFHYFVVGGEDGEKDLWESYEKIQTVAEKWERPLPIDWKGLHQAATQFIAKSPLFVERHRIIKLRQLRVAVGVQQLSEQDIVEYLLNSEETPTYVLQHLENLAQRQNLKEVEYRVIEKRAHQSHYTNSDLDRLWHKASQDQDHDLAWRVATLLLARGVLHEKVSHAWSISGEKRVEYSLQKLSWDLARQVLEGTNKEENKFLSAVLKVGPLIPDLIALMDDKVKVVKSPMLKPDSMEAHVEKCLDSIDWLTRPKKHYRFSHDGMAMGGMQVPSFIQVLPNNTWSYLLIRLGERLGLSSWMWQLSWLNQKLEGVMPKLAMGHEDKFSGHVAKWLKTLTPDQRAAWYDLVSLAGKMSDQKGLELMTLLISRLAVMIVQNHYQALQSLRTMRTPIYVIWQVENWILSSTYGKVRRSMGTLNRVPVPTALKTLGIVKREVEG